MDNGLFQGNSSGIAQLVLGNRFKLGLTYIHAYPDLGKKGNIAAIVAGAESTLRGLDIRGATGNFNRDFAYHMEAFYKFKVNKNLSITPGVIWLTSPNQNENNSDAIIGILRTTFTF